MRWYHARMETPKAPIYLALALATTLAACSSTNEAGGPSGSGNASGTSDATSSTASGMGGDASGAGGSTTTGNGGSSTGPGGSSGSGGAPPCETKAFSATPADFALPPFTASNGDAFQIGGTSYCGNPTSNYTTLDLDGDGHFDLVYTKACSEAAKPVIGVSKWSYFKGGATGFAATPSDFALPPFTAMNGNAYQIAGTVYCGNPTSNYTILDLDGDGHLDLVYTKVCSESAKPVTGVSRWLYFKGGANGFASTPTDYALPPFVAANGNAYETGGTAYCGNPTSNYTTVDLDGDGRLDLVYTKACTEAAKPVVGVSKWIYFKGGPSGFAATASDYALPPASASNGDVFELGGTAYCGNPTSNYSTLDLDRDGRLDLVYTKLCSEAAKPVVGVSKWIYFKGGANGFAAAATDFALPPFTASNGNAYQLAGTSYCGNPTSNYGIMDIDADGRFDLVYTKACTESAKPVIGVSKWAFFKGGPNGFAATATDFPLPPFTATSGDAFQSSGTAYCGNPTSNYASIDLDVDGHVDLLYTKVCGEAAKPVTGVSKWLIFRGICQ